MIFLKPIGGLGNRMYAINGMKTLAERMGIPMKVFWQLGSDCNCPYKNLFEKNNYFSVEEINIDNPYTKYILYPTLIKKNNVETTPLIKKQLIRVLQLFRKMHYDLVLSNQEIFTIKKINNQNYNFLNKFSRIYISTFIGAVKHKITYSQWKPVKPLRDEIDKVKSSFSKNTIGIHIRRTDNRLSIEHSPKELFIKKMKNEIKQDKRTKFYLASDSMEIEAEMREIFGQKIISRKKVLSRNSPKGIQDALVDMYSLGSTKKIYGSYHSSFSNIAADLFDTELEILYHL